MRIENGTVVSHEPMGPHYRVLTLTLPEVTVSAIPGQFVHVRIAKLHDAVLRRPFSIYKVDGQNLSILYKSIGRGTATMQALSPGEPVSVVGPLGNGFPVPLEAIGWEVRIATDDGSLGEKGLVTAPLDAWLKAGAGKVKPEFFACGPNGMLKAVGDRAINGNWNAWLSLDRHMGCGVGACLACVQKVRLNGQDTLARVCKDGPIFESRDIIWDD